MCTSIATPVILHIIRSECKPAMKDVKFFSFTCIITFPSLSDFLTEFVVVAVVVVS